MIATQQIRIKRLFRAHVLYIIINKQKREKFKEKSSCKTKKSVYILANKAL